MRIKYIVRLIPLASNTIELSTFLLSSYLAIIHLILNHYLLYGLISIVVMSSYAVLINRPALYSTLCYYLVCGYCRIRFLTLNQLMVAFERKQFKSPKELAKLIAKHNSILRLIRRYNVFWSTFFLCFNMCIIPMNLLFLFQILFSNASNILLLILFVSSFVFQFLSHFFLNLMTASVYTEANKSYKVLLKILNYLNVLIAL